MSPNEIAHYVDHTLLSQTATLQEILKICDEAEKLEAASVCIPPCHVTSAYERFRGKFKICTVIGFPNGYSTLKAKSAEVIDAIEHGADEIDMVINLSFLKDKRYSEVKNEIVSLKSLCGDKVLKVIVETCFLTYEEKVRMCELIVESKADYIKTSTGFGNGNATLEDVSLFSNILEGTSVKIKASGGIQNFETAEKFIKLGADRLGSSSLLKLLL